MWSILFRYFINSLKIVLSNGVQTSYVPVQVSLKLPFIETIKMQFTAILVGDQSLVEVMICASVTTLIPINNHTPTLATIPLILTRGFPTRATRTPRDYAPEVREKCVVKETFCFCFIFVKIWDIHFFYISRIINCNIRLR